MASIGIRGVAERAGVSVGTVSNALNHPEKVSAASLGRIREAIAELGYVRNDAARMLRAGQSQTIGLVVLDVRNPFFTDLARGAEDEAVRHGMSVILGNSAEDSAREAGYLDLFEEQRVRGVLISPYGRIDERLRLLRERGIPAVLVDRASSDRRVSSVSVDDVAGGRMAAAHLLQIGRRRIAFVGGPVGIRQVADRLTGAREAVASIDGATLEVVPTAALTVTEGRRAGRALLASARMPDAVLAANDLVALGVLETLVVEGSVRVPGDVALIGYDDIDVASAAMVPLSSVRQPTELIGRTAVGILLEEAAAAQPRPRQVVFQPELVVRASSGG
ncbi:LacI family DNA-binding transcriptional regulator [Pseudolysinimonas kribbensis]|uniref:LacI family transcriptional regulator n=1 Tax=Pseudolysinimonas kribbensis TaxID=433641 RepID=A0ABQ6K302_9MICO|nr:LacI family DNA-binding transcriptional regulator [Pseudolysinimonas kribbensis]GMA95008.1 LacI family transcriptional regulator [Pseudolysinimonas kribbensis]